MREKICIITAHYYQKITSDLYNGATLVLNKHKISSEWIKVPGVFEIPVTIVKNIESYDAEKSFLKIDMTRNTNSVKKY